VNSLNADPDEGADLEQLLGGSARRVAAAERDESQVLISQRKPSGITAIGVLLADCQTYKLKVAHSQIIRYAITNPKTGI
jgi:hypothetical protein